MRLIDADALTNHMKDGLCFLVECEECTFFQPYDKECILKIWVDNAPTIDAEPKHQLSEETSTLDICPYYHHELTGEPFCEMEDRRHGEWKDIDGDGHYWECSACGEVLCCNNNFCPNCGAKMDGERSEE